MTTIRRQLTWKLLVAFAVPLVIGGAIAYALIRDELIEQFDSALAAQASAIGAVTRIQSDGTVDVSSSAAVLRDFAAPEAGEVDEDESPPVFQIRRIDGSTVARSASLHSADLPRAELDAEEPRFWNLVLPSGVAGRAVGIRFRPRVGGDATTAAENLIIVAALDRRDLDRTVASLGWLLAGTGVFLLLITSVVVPRVVRRAVAPIDALAEEAARITADSLGTRFSTVGLPAELEPIGRRLNDLLGRLETSFERERRFSADLAHELRTPLAELRTLAELSVKWPDARVADADRDVLAIATQMEAIVTRLLALLRSEHGRVELVRERVDAATVLRHAWQPLEARAEARSLRVVWNVQPETIVMTDPVLLHSILANLLQNATDYAPTGGEVAITARSHPTGLEVRVRNRADDLSAEDISKLFDRFWRRDPARSGGEHAGLGLSLARAFARALGADLRAERGPAGELEMILTAP